MAVKLQAGPSKQMLMLCLNPLSLSLFFQLSAPVVAAPVATAPATPVAVGTVREERVQLVSGQGLKAYSVVCGSFGVKANADGLKAKLDRDGYSALVVYTADKNMYRVIVSSFDSREDAARARDSFKAKYSNNAEFQKSWLLYAR